MAEETVVDPVVETTEVAPEAQSLRDHFLATVPDERRDEAVRAIEKWKDDPAFVDGFFAQKAMIGKKGDIPPEDATPEQVAEFWEKLGASKIQPSDYEYGEEYGDMAATLKEQHTEIDKKITELFNEAVKDSRTLPEIKEKVLKAYLASEADALRQQATAEQKQTEEDFKKIAVEAGLSTEQLNGAIKGVMSKYGWDETTPIPKVLYTLAKETADTQTLEQSRLNSSLPGLDQQIQTILESDEYLNPYHADNEKAVKKLTALGARRAEISQK